MRSFQVFFKCHLHSIIYFKLLTFVKEVNSERVSQIFLYLLFPVFSSYILHFALKSHSDLTLFNAALACCIKMEHRLRIHTTILTSVLKVKWKSLACLILYTTTQIG